MRCAVTCSACSSSVSLKSSQVMFSTIPLAFSRACRTPAAATRAADTHAFVVQLQQNVFITSAKGFYQDKAAFATFTRGIHEDTITYVRQESSLITTAYKKAQHSLGSTW